MIHDHHDYSMCEIWFSIEICKIYDLDYFNIDLSIFEPHTNKLKYLLLG